MTWSVTHVGQLQTIVCMWDGIAVMSGVVEVMPPVTTFCVIVLRGCVTFIGGSVTPCVRELMLHVVGEVGVSSDEDLGISKSSSRSLRVVAENLLTAPE